MKYIQKFEAFSNAEPIVKPAKPKVNPITKPNRPSPFRRDKPSVEPAPKASAEKVAERFINLLVKSGDDIKNYI